LPLPLEEPARIAFPIRKRNSPFPLAGEVARSAGEGKRSEARSKTVCSTQGRPHPTLSRKRERA